MLLFAHILTPHQQGFRIITVDYYQKSCKIWTPFKKFLRKSKENREIKLHMKRLNPLAPASIENIKHSLAPSQINIKSHIT